MIRTGEGAWLPSQSRGLVWADEAVADGVQVEIEQARISAVNDLITRLVGSIVETEVGPCIPWREVLRLSQESR